jgi:hypothetical protein
MRRTIATFVQAVRCGGASTLFRLFDLKKNQNAQQGTFEISEHRAPKPKNGD